MTKNRSDLGRFLYFNRYASGRLDDNRRFPYIPFEEKRFKNYIGGRVKPILNRPTAQIKINYLIYKQLKWAVCGRIEFIW